MPGVSGVTVVTNACAFYQYTRGCGRIGRPAFPAPSVFRGQSFRQGSGKSRRENADLRHDVIARSEVTKQSILSARGEIETARAFPDAVIVPLHTDGWAHFRQNALDLRASFDTLGFGSRPKLLEPGVATVIEVPC